MKTNPYSRASDPAKRRSALLTDGLDRAPRARCSKVSVSRTTTSRGP
jgi:hypothetical protein